ncbi:MAG: GntR family transcriptional regulator YhfZ [Enterobacteriaceae bacterium]
MGRQFIKKEGVSLVFLSRYLLSATLNERIKTIDELAEESALSVGLIQRALKTLEQNQAILLERCGRNGTWLRAVDQTALLKQADIGNIVCAMPLPYTKRYEGLASGLKAQLEGVPFYYAHMRGADTRVECLRNGIYHMAVVSGLAAQHYLDQGEVKAILRLGKQSYVGEHQLIRRVGDNSPIRRIGIDRRSADQKILTDIYFAPQNVTWVDISYHECLAGLERGIIDAVIWNSDNAQALQQHQLAQHPLPPTPALLQASEAIVLISTDDVLTQQLLLNRVNPKQILSHQQAVLQKTIEPVY